MIDTIDLVLVKSLLSRSFNPLADARSVPNGFSTTMRSLSLWEAILCLATLLEMTSIKPGATE
ncbi:hypothetical protein KRR40_11325 [Niabella defluvii]|nr:hypothetical protein KRR40_11325 [Niabella sp. I65]